MHTPAVWRDDPACGHQVEHAYQTHYCTYIRVPRLLTLQPAASDDELALMVAHQWYELWFKVLRVDLRAALASDSQTYEAVKLTGARTHAEDLNKAGWKLAHITPVASRVPRRCPTSPSRACKSTSGSSCRRRICLPSPWRWPGWRRRRKRWRLSWRGEWRGVEARVARNARVR